MELKERILEVLGKKDFTYSQLANHLGTTEKELDYALEHNTLEIRVLELISKELRIPLYSFFRNPFDEQITENQEKFYSVSIWKDGEEKYKSQVLKLSSELEKLKADLQKKELLIKELQTRSKVC